jgi:hypothetical protein
MVYCIVITSSKEITNGNNQCWADTGFEGWELLGGSCMSHFTLSDISKAIRVIRKVRKTLNLVTHRVRFLKNLQNSILAFNGGWNSKNHQFWWETEFHPVFPFSWAPPL